MSYTPFIHAFTIKPTLRNLTNVEPFRTKQLDRTDDFNYVGFGKRLFITIMNVCVNVLFIFLGVYFVIPYSIEYNSVLPQFIYFLVWFGFYTYLLVSFGVTIGSFCVQGKVVDIKGNYLNMSTAVFRNLPYLCSLALHTAVVYNTIESIPESEIPYGFDALFNAYNTHSPFTFQILLSFQLFIVFDTLSTMFNPQRRALRDFLADSFVIDRRNYYRIFINNKHLGSGVPIKSEEQLKKEKAREFEFKILNHVMEVPEVMKEIQRANEFKVSKIIVKIEARPEVGKRTYYEISIKENAIPLFHFRIEPKNMRITAKDKDQFISLAQWRKKHYNTSWIKSYFFMH